MEKYIPDIYQKSIYAIDYQRLLEKGIKCILFDLDNTLVPYNIKNTDDKMKQLFHELKEMGFKLILFSNNNKKRLKPFKEDLNVDCCCHAQKPRSKNFWKIMQEYKYEETDLAIIGDQMLTDIAGGNRVGITTILINPVSTKDAFWTIPNRMYERKIMKKLRDHDLFSKGRYYE